MPITFADNSARRVPGAGGAATMSDVFICDAVRTPIGRFGGSLAKIRTDDLAAVPLKALKERNPNVDWSDLDEVSFGCANQAGEDNRNVARMAVLLAGFPESIPASTVNRLCASGLDAIGSVSRAIRAGEIDFGIAGGVESMTRAPFVMGKANEAFSRSAEIYDTTIRMRSRSARRSARARRSPRAILPRRSSRSQCPAARPDR
jgi:3-oxoadipyl-CoA thiolase